jgi:hypothetical protein
MQSCDDEVQIRSRDYWFKIVEFLQRNWALIDDQDSGPAKVWFFGDDSGVFDELDFNSEIEASDTLLRNGFRRFVEAAESREFLRPPSPPFVRRSHPNGPVYSSGRFWMGI